jgi:hypothetical protein
MNMQFVPLLHNAATLDITCRRHNQQMPLGIRSREQHALRFLPHEFRGLQVEYNYHQLTDERIGSIMLSYACNDLAPFVADFHLDLQ